MLYCVKIDDGQSPKGEDCRPYRVAVESSLDNIKDLIICVKGGENFVI